MESRTTGTHDGGKLHERSHGGRAREITEALGSGIERRLHSPLLAASVAGGLGLLAANLFGVGEVAIAGAAGYLVYRRFIAERTNEPGAEPKSKR
jgi:hypothetical protein